MNFNVLEILSMKVVKRFRFIHGSAESFRPIENETVVQNNENESEKAWELKSDEIYMFKGIN